MLNQMRVGSTLHARGSSSPKGPSITCCVSGLVLMLVTVFVGAESKNLWVYPDKLLAGFCLAVPCFGLIDSRMKVS